MFVALLTVSCAKRNIKPVLPMKDASCDCAQETVNKATNININSFFIVTAWANLTFLVQLM